MPEVVRKGRKTKHGLSLAVSGDLTAPGAVAFRDAMREALDEALPDAKRIRVDLSEIGDLDLAGLQVILAAEANVSSAGGRMDWWDSLPDANRPLLASCGFGNREPGNESAGPPIGA